MTTPLTPAQIIEVAGQDLAAAAAAINDPLERAEALEDAARYAVADLQLLIRSHRAAALHRALATSSVAEISEALGLSKARVYKLLEGADSLGGAEA